MWTPKRIMLLSGCFVAFFMLYLGYAYSYVGRIDGLPPLPVEFWPNPGSKPPIPPRSKSKLEKMIKEAFGENCPELKQPIRLQIHSRNMLLAAGEFRPLPDGRVLLAPLSIALFNKGKVAGQPPEINSIRGEQAWLTFDRPVSNFSEIPSRKIVAVELAGRIEAVSNRRRPQRDEDLRLSIASGTLHYLEATKKIWTEAYVVVEDHKHKPPHVIKGKGMEMELLTETQPSRPGSGRKGGKESIAGVKWVMLHSSVEMELYIDQGGFVPSTSSISQAGQQPTQSKGGKTGPAVVKQPSQPGASRPAQKSRLHITTPGRFRYELHKDHDLARFDIEPATPPARASVQPRHVVVDRYLLESKEHDQLVCHHLTLRLHRREQKEAAAKTVPPREGNTTVESVEIETVHATADPGKTVLLVSDAEKLKARGTDFFHDAIHQLTVLKGNPVEVDKEENTLTAACVRILQVKPPPKGSDPTAKPYQHMEATGPGDILLLDRKEKKTIRAFWQNLLTVTKDGTQDLLILTGQARFIDEQTEQSLRADTIKVWLEEVQKKKASPRQGESTTDSRRPRHLEATGNVVARSREINVHDTARLVTWFKDVPAETHLPPGSVVPAGKPDAPGRGFAPRGPSGARPNKQETSPPLQPAGPRPLPTGPARPGQLTSNKAAAGPVLGAPTSRTPARPFDLSARSVEAWVLRSPIKSTIDQLWCEGSVHVKQDPAKAEEKGTEVEGETLRMTAGGDNLYFLVVTGDLARLQTDKILIIGPEVNIDQTTNKAWVNGDGAMKMESVTNLQGEPLEKPVPLTVHWSQKMLFNGHTADFVGNIQAVQEKARLACQGLQVTFDRPISLRHGNKTAEPAKVRTLVCDRDVRVEETTYEGDKIRKYTLIQGPELQMMALEPDQESGGKKSAGNMVRGSGPGNVRTWEPGTQEEFIGGDPRGPGPARTTSGKPKKEEMKMTYVAYQNRLDANSKTNTANFWGNVRVLHMPCARHDAVIDLDVILATDLPEGSLYIRCDRLKVLDRPTDGKPNKQLEAHGKVYTQGREFFGRADVVHYNQQKQQVIFEAREGSLASLAKVPHPGAQPQVVEGKKIIYNRATGKTDVYGASSVTGTTPARQP